MTCGDKLGLTASSLEALGTHAPAEMSGQEAATSADIRTEVRRIIGSGQFDASERNRRFLEYVVEETLAGRADRIKAYTIATTVFGRDVHFDPQQDPVVRMEARRLRRSLERFYLTEGKRSSVRITMPKGGYVPEFNEASADPKAGQEVASDTPYLDDYFSSVLVKSFEVEGDQSIFLEYEQGLTRQLMIGLSRYPHLCVFGSKSHPPRASGHDGGFVQAGRDADFVLTGSKAVIAGMLYVKAVLLDARTGRVVWGQSFERALQPKGILSVRDEVANSIVQTLAQPFGVIFNYRAEKTRAKEHQLPTASHCVMLFHQYRRSYRRDLFQRARECLEHVVAIDSACAEVFACLSEIYTDGHRFGFASGELAAVLRRRAAALAHMAIETAPDSSCGYHALGLACWFQQDVEASLRATQTALALNANAVEVTADLGLRWSLMAEWQRAIPFLEYASATNPIHVSDHRIGLSLYHFIGGRFEQALAAAKDFHAPDVTHGYVAQAISLVRLGRAEEAADAVRCILDLDPNYGRGNDGVLADLSGGNLNPDLADRIGEALADAGLHGLPRSAEMRPAFGPFASTAGEATLR